MKLHSNIYAETGIFYQWILKWKKAFDNQSCPTLCDPMDCGLPGSSVRGILQERILEWVAISYSRGSSWLRDRTLVSYMSCTGRRILCHCATWEAQKMPYQGKCLVGQPAAHWDRSPLTLQYSQCTMILHQTTTIIYVHERSDRIDRKTKRVWFFQK